MAANALVRVAFTLDISEEAINRIVGRQDDGSEAWREDAYDKLEAHFTDDFHEHLDAMTNGEPDVDVDLA